MNNIDVFDPALCCSTGVCGPEVDQSLLNFAADVDWLKSRGGLVTRFNLAQDPLAFVNNATVKSCLERSGQSALPLILVDGQIAFAGRYPTREELLRLSGLSGEEGEATGQPSDSCCGQSGCC